ncbi:MAG: RNA ligase [Nitrospirae bacterium]|nr:RNA ligase [Nitrospirota bacterium]
MKTPPSFIKKYFTDEEIKELQMREILHEEECKGILIVRLMHDYKDFLRGTVFYEEGFIPGYPRIMRVLHLGNGIKRYFNEGFYVEEKVDGYNVRIARIDEVPIALTRGGFICPFTTDRIPDLIDMNFFNKYPEYVIGGEIVGPNNPYNTEFIPYIKEDVVLLSFDLFEKTRRRLNPEERYKILEDFNIKQVRRWGPFSLLDIEEIKKIVLELDRNGREGIVIKPLTIGKPIKYVTLSSCLRDLQATANLITELPAGFYMQRILRTIFFCYEFDITLDDRYLLDFSKALCITPQKVIEEVAEGGDIREFFEIKVRNEDAITSLMEHLKRSGIKTKLLSSERIDNFYSAKFQRIYTEGTKEIRQRLMGHGFFD